MLTKFMQLCCCHQQLHIQLQVPSTKARSKDLTKGKALRAKQYMYVHTSIDAHGSIEPPINCEINRRLLCGYAFLVYFPHNLNGQNHAIILNCSFCLSISSSRSSCFRHLKCPAQTKFSGGEKRVKLT